MFRDGPVKGIVLLAMLGSSVLSAALSTAQTQAVAYAEECKNEESAEYKACVAAKEKEHKEKCDKVDRDIEQAQAKCRAEGSDNCDAIGALGHCAYPLFGFSCSVEQCTEFVRSGRYARGDSEERSRAQAVVENVVQTAADAVAPLGPTTVEAVGKFAATFPKLFRDQLMKQIDLARLDEVSDDKTGTNESASSSHRKYAS